ncbi:MAG: hypothetical protein G01um101417_516 [Parcubacteria group bacterium Gr01-1014_17]|nr:MAG: hypothetical protein G01um101417_516 [Parcubacteria group bacterium Gr01-1014_17]
MKRYPIFFGTAFIFLGAFLFYGNANAISGTCSYHGGVNCYAGSDWDGSAICNDGWRDSTESYYSVSQCNDVLHSCTLDEWNKLENESRIPLIQQKIDTTTPRLNELTAQLDSLSEQLKTIVSDRDAQNTKGGTVPLDFLNVRQQEVNIEAAIKSLEITPKVRQVSLEISNLQSERRSYQDELHYEDGRIKKVCYLKGEDTFQKRRFELDMLPSCLNLYGVFSHFDTNSEKCICNTGYAYADGQCKEVNLVCKDRIGADSKATWVKDANWKDVFICECMNGYNLNILGQCDSKPKSAMKISERALKFGNSILLSCDNTALNEQEKNECKNYRLYSDRNREYTWEVYDSDAKTTQTEIQKTVEPQPIPPVKIDEKVITKNNEVKKTVVKPPPTQNPFITKTDTVASSSIKVSVEHKQNKQAGFFAKIKNMLLSIWR